MAAVKPAASGIGAPFCWPKDSNPGTSSAETGHWLEIIYHSRQGLQA